MKLEADFNEIPESAVFEYGISIVVYMTQEGDQKYGIIAQGQLSAVSLVGVLELAKRTMLEQNN